MHHSNNKQIYHLYLHVNRQPLFTFIVDLYNHDPFC